MFSTLTQKLSKIFDRLKNSGAVTETEINNTMRELRIALLESDVALSVVKIFISEVSNKIKEVELSNSLSPVQIITKIINDKIIYLLQPDKNESKINLKGIIPISLLILGLQGSGKTTTSAKLALKLKGLGKKILLVSLDTYRPAAQAQLEILAKSIGVDSLPIVIEESPLDITKRAILTASLLKYDIVIYDTAGRLHIDEAMINEIVRIKQLVNPTESFLVMDAMMGQDAVNVASIFNEKMDITGVILTRIDGDSKGGAALSVRHVTGKPIKFLSTGEKTDSFEEFDAKRISSRILDMGDVKSLIEKTISTINHDDVQNTSTRLKKGIFDLNDYISQIKSIKKMGGITNLIGFLPGVAKFSSKMKDDLFFREGMLSRQIAIVSSMTEKERKNPDILNGSRKRRIAMGSGTTVQQINTFLKQFKQMSNVLKKVSKMNSKSFTNIITKIFS